MKFFVRKKVERRGNRSMKKIFFLCAGIVIIIIAGEFFLQRKTFENFDYMIDLLNDIDEKNDTNTKLENIEKIESFWKNKYLLMAFYIDHVELEKIKSQIVVIKAGIEKHDEPFVHEEIKRTIYMIEHIKDKIVIKADNIL